MDQHPQATTATAALFTLETYANGALPAEQQHLADLAAQLALGRPQLSALHAVMAWAVFLRPSTDPAERERLRAHLDVMGYLPADRKIVAGAERSRDAVDAALPALLEGF